VAPDIRRACRQKAQAMVQTLGPLLGSPYYVREGVVLYKQDAQTVLEVMPQTSIKVDLSVTSPPYNIGKAYEEKRPLEDYLLWCSHWLHGIWQVTNVTGALWLNLGYLAVEGKGRAVPIPYLLWDQTSFFLQQEIVWHYGAGVSTKRVFAPRNEKWLFYTKDPETYAFNLDDVRDPNVKYPNQKKNGIYRCNHLGKNPSDVWEFPKVTSGTQRSSRERTIHPAQFPLAVIDRIVKVSSTYTDVVLDPFSGSGSTGIAAAGNGRVYLGIEQRDDYCQATAERFDRFFQENSLQAQD
jgi:adenine-specific DNA-methyltransferase